MLMDVDVTWWFNMNPMPWTCQSGKMVAAFERFPSQGEDTEQKDSREIQRVKANNQQLQSTPVKQGHR